jgi:two-component system, NarL family, nitrate/nitrite response regulator NarL
MSQTGNLNLSKSVNLYLLAENRLLRETLAKFIRKRSDINVVGVGSSLESIVSDIANSSFEVILTDCFDESSHPGFLSLLQQQGVEIKLILFGMSPDPALFLKAVECGICGYLLKEASSTEIVAAIHAAVRGEATCPPSLCMSLIRHFSRLHKFGALGAEGHKPKSLTPRQHQLLRLVAKGLTNKEIAENLNLSQFTVKNHLRRVMRQAEASNRNDAVDLFRASGQLSGA